MSIVPVIASYLIGSINFAYIVAKFKNINIQEIGSGNPGSSNVLRALGKKYAIIVLVGDLFKGIAPFLIFGGELETLIYASLAVIGHCFPIFYGLILVQRLLLLEAQGEWKYRYYPYYTFGQDLACILGFHLE